MPGTHPRGPPQVNPRRPPSGGRHLCTTPAHSPVTLTGECYLVVSLLSSKIGGLKGFASIPSSGELPCEGKLHRRYSHGVDFQIYFCFQNVLWNEGFYGGCSANPAINLLIRSNPTAGGRPQTKLGTRSGWPLAHKELLRPFTGFVLHPAGYPYPNTLLTKKLGGGDGLVADNPTIQ